MPISKKKSDGRAFILFGIALSAMGLIAIGLFTAGISSISRTETLMVIGVPVGVIAIVIGVIKVRRERRQR